MEGDTGKYTLKSELSITQESEPKQVRIQDGDHQTQDQNEVKEVAPLSQDEITDSALDKTCSDKSDSAPPSLTKIQSADDSLVIANQPRRSSRKVADCSFHSPFNDAHSDRDWATNLCPERTEQRSHLAQCCCWPAYRYGLAIRLGETPFMPLIPCAAFALRIKIRSLFGIKGSLMKDFFTALCCEPCAVCQMTREMDHIGL